MAFMTTTRKVKLAKRGATTAVKHPKATRRAGRAAMIVAKPLARRKLRRTAKSAAGTGRQAVQAGRQAALGVAGVAQQGWRVAGEMQAPPRQRTAPRVLIGIVIGAGAMYLLEPGAGAEHRRTLARAVGGGTGDSGDFGDSGHSGDFGHSGDSGDSGD